jgi:hypothetical protein
MDLVSLKQKLKSITPWAILWSYYWLTTRKSRKTIFSNIFASGGFGGAESVSGRGSDTAHTVVARQFISELVGKLSIATILDLPCGDFHWMQQVDLKGANYIGADIVEPLIASNQQKYESENIKFLCLDICQDGLPQADLIICRDCLTHLCNSDVLRALSNIRASGALYLLATTFPDGTNRHDIINGWWRAINLEAPPFNLPTPMQLVLESPQLEDLSDPHYGKCLAVWQLR